MSERKSTHLVFVAGKSVYPMYQLLALKHKNSARWTKVDILSNAATNPSLEKVLNLLRDEGWSVPIEIHNYSDPSIGFEEIDKLFQSIEVEPGKSVAICPGLGPRTLTVPMLWKMKEQWDYSTLKISQHKNQPFLIEEKPVIIHNLPTLNLDDFLGIYECKTIEDDRNSYLIDTDANRIGPFTDIQYDGFVRFFYDTRNGLNYEESKTLERRINSTISQLEALFGRNAFVFNVIVPPNSRINSGSNLVALKLKYLFIFHIFVDPRNITMAGLTLYQIHRFFKTFDIKIFCYVVEDRGSTLDDCLNELKLRFKKTVGKNDSKNRPRNPGNTILDDAEIVPISRLQEVQFLERLQDTFYHIVNTKTGTIEGHQILESALNPVLKNNNKRLANYEPNNHTFTFELTENDDVNVLFKSRSKVIPLIDAYAMSGWELTGESKPRWHPPPRAFNKKDVMDDIYNLTSTFVENIQTTITKDGTHSVNSLRIIPPEKFQFEFGQEDHLVGRTLCIPMHALACSENAPFVGLWRPSGGVWLEVLCEFMIWSLFSDSKVTIIYEPKMKSLHNSMATYTPEGVVQLQDGTQVVWEVKSVPTSHPNWEKYIPQICEYGNLSPYRNTIPLIVHSDQNPTDKVLELARNSKVIMSPWWEINDLRNKIKEWGEINGVTIPSLDKIPQRDFRTEMVGSIETTFDERENEKKTKFIHPDRGMVEEWIRSLSESELEQYEKDSWNRTIYSALDSKIILPDSVGGSPSEKVSKKGTSNVHDEIFTGVIQSTQITRLSPDVNAFTINNVQNLENIVIALGKKTAKQIFAQTEPNNNFSFEIVIIDSIPESHKSGAFYSKDANAWLKKCVRL